MPFFKTWNVSRTSKKAVVADTLEELVRKGREKLGLVDAGECKVFDLTDGTEIDDDECLLAYDKGSVFIIGKQWKADVPAEVQAVPPCLIKVASTQEVTGVGKQAEFEEDVKSEEDVRLESVAEGDYVVKIEEGVGSEEDVGFGKSAEDDMVEIEEGVGSEEDVGFGKSAEDDMVEIEEGVGSEEDVGFGKSAEDDMVEIEEGVGSCDDFDVGMEFGVHEGEGEKLDEEIEKTEGEKRPTEEPETCGKRRKSDLSVDPPLGTVTEALMKANPYMNARMKNLKIYNDDEIRSANSEMEKKRRRFWNEKAEQVAKSPKTANLNKMTITGIIDVSWTMRKTTFVDIDARKTLDEEKVLFRTEQQRGKMGSQKKETILKNLDRMASAHTAVENVDKEIETCRENCNKATSGKERNPHKKEYIRKKKILDSAYTELKRAQDATIKSIKVKRKQLDDILKSKNVDSEQPSTSSTKDVLE